MEKGRNCAHNFGLVSAFSAGRWSSRQKEAGNISSFELAGADGVFQPALATVRGDAIELTNPAVAQPTTARYGWANNPRLTLYNAAGLPAPPFTTVMP